MATVYCELLGRLPLSSTDISFTVGSNVCSLSTGYYYMYGYTGETAEQLLPHLQAVIRNSSAFTGANVSYIRPSASAVNAYVNISLGATNSNISFNHAGLATILGMAQYSSNLAVHTGTRKPRYVWRPSDPVQDCDTSPEELFGPVGTSKVYRSEDGSVSSVDGMTVLRDGTLRFQALPRADVISNIASQDYRSLEQFWEDVIARGRPMRVYPDRSVNTSTDYVTAVYAAETPGPFTAAATKVLVSYLGYWGVELPLWKVT